ncbi:MAG: G/U mismatch-specific DNA glycosylase [Anaerolineae bacterium]|nr:G/U mismatch-specific DNA glycosylase [Phycisphaerae bacterium]
MAPPLRPTKQQLLDARDKLVPDVIAPKLRVLFSGINPGLYSAATGHHFARPGNRFWPALFAGGFTPRQLSPWEENELLDMKIGITNIVKRTTATADQLDRDELIRGAKQLIAKVKRYEPEVLAIVGVGAYRTAFQKPDAQLGLQPETIGATQIWLLPNPSGLNAHYQPADLARLFKELRRFVNRR